MANEFEHSESRGPDVSVTPELQLLRDVYEHFPEFVLATTRAAPFPEGLNHIKFRFELSGIGNVEFELTGKPDMAAGSKASESELYRPVGTGPCIPTNQMARQILQTCEDVYEANKNDCNQFVKAASNPYFGDIFNGLDADGIIAKLSDSASRWSRTNSITECIKQAQSGNFVIAGMTSAELGAGHGHLAVVVACPPQLSDNTKVPLGYAGSIGGGAIKGERLTGTFRAQLVRDEMVPYFWKTPTT